MEIVLFLFIAPVLAAVIQPAIRTIRSRSIAAVGSAIVISGGVIALFFLDIKESPAFFTAHSNAVNMAVLAGEILLSVYVVITGLKHKRYLAVLLMLAQIAIILGLELFYGDRLSAAHNLFLDRFSIIMAFIIGIIGSLIMVYACGYMKDFHTQHPEVRDRSSFFFIVCYLFLASMFVLVFANNLVWLHFCWELTTLASFLLIGYADTDEAVNNAFTALTMNLLGGLAFAGGIAYLCVAHGIVELDRLLAMNKYSVVLPVVLLSLAGITKSAQLPFSGWLLGAMVAPTPSSALLHSSTMVKAGVYLLLRLSPLLAHTLTGSMVTLVGGASFLVASLIAVSQRNAKRVLAYSTVANLGLIVACAGIGSAGTLWAGIFLILFHAVAKSLLFQSVGTVEHRLHSRDIEDMDNLINRMPRVTAMMVVGISGMFLAPFGMLISKWAALKAFIDIDSMLGLVLIVLLSYGSAATLFFWTKWMGKIISMKNKKIEGGNMDAAVSRQELSSESIHAVLTVVLCLAFPLISQLLVEPYVSRISGIDYGIARGNYVIMGIMVSMLIALPVIIIRLQRHAQFVMSDGYTSGHTVSSDRHYIGSLGIDRKISMKNIYMKEYFGEKKIFAAGTAAGILFIIAMVAGALI